MMFIINVNSNNSLAVIYKSSRIAFHDVCDHSWILWRHTTGSTCSSAPIIFSMCRNWSVLPQFL